TATGDVLVGADGSTSKVREQYVPHAQVVDTGVIGIAGRYPLTAETQDRLPKPLTTRMNNILPPRSCGMFVAQYIQKPSSGVAPTGLLADNMADHVFWAFIAGRDKYQSQGAVRPLDPALLQGFVLGMIVDWHPDLRRLVAETDPQTIMAIPLHTSTP